MLSRSARLLVPRPRPGPRRAALRPLSTSGCWCASPVPPRPTFTTPELPRTAYAAEDLSKPLPPTDLPIEDYASPLMHTASSIGTFFRYAVYTSVGVVVLTLSAFAGVHVWVEHVELAGGDGAGAGAGAGDGDAHRWVEELDGWSGAHRGGGTDPRLGLRARMAVRSAWIGQSWGGGIAASPVATTPGAFASPSGGGGTMIGAPRPAASREVRDAGWQMAEGYLVYAITRAAQKGIALAAADHAGQVDRAAVELEQRLAGVRERIGGRYKLEEARAGWERIYYALAASADPATPAAAWAQREQVRATKKLGEISARLAALEPDGSPDRKLENAKAEGWFIGGLLPALTDAVGSTAALALDHSSSTKSLSPSSSFFAFWSRSHPPSNTASTPSTTPIPSSVRPHLASLTRLVDDAAALPNLDPATARTILTSLASLETFLARTRDLPAAEAIQRASLALANALHRAPAFAAEPDLTTLRPDPSAPRTLPWTKPEWVSPTLAQLSLLTRTSLIATHLAEVSLAQGYPAPDALVRLQGAINDCDVIISALESSPLLSPTVGLSRALPSKSRRELESAAAAIVRDARLTGAMAARLTAYVHEAGCGTLARQKRVSAREQARRRAWCGGDASAEAFYAKAMEFAGPSARSQGKVFDDKGYSEAEAGFRRVKAAVLAAELAATSP